MAEFDRPRRHCELLKLLLQVRDDDGRYSTSTRDSILEMECMKRAE